ncbi:MAG: T9SS type A sorting domain-containing protein [Bacteroidales bacterium]|nr:T9SS type A sorting domain-containing protein [Bacteroidales bacterium]
MTATPGYNADLCKWYASESSSVVLSTSLLFSPILTSDTIFYVTSYNSTENKESSERKAVFIQVNPQPQMPIVSDVSRCEVGEVTLFATNDSLGTTCLWYSADSLLTIGEGLFYKDTLDTTTNYYVTSFNEFTGCESQKSVVIATVNFPSDTTFLEATLCQGESFNEEGFDISKPTDTTYYYQTLQNVNGCDSVIALFTYVFPISDTSLYDTIYVNETYTENGFNYDGLDHPGNKTLSITLKNIYDCDSTVFLYLKIIKAPEVDTTNIENNAFSTVKIYPNPANDQLTISGSLNGLQEIQILDMTGKVLFTKRTLDNDRITIDVQSLASGYYFVRLIATTRQQTLRFIKQ